jgi:hypothetical protein
MVLLRLVPSSHSPILLICDSVRKKIPKDPPSAYLLRLSLPWFLSFTHLLALGKVDFHMLCLGVSVFEIGPVAGSFRDLWGSI